MWGKLKHGEIIHIHPIEDSFQHVHPNCWCEPAIEQDGKLIIHNSADERELYEQGILKAH